MPPVYGMYRDVILRIRKQPFKKPVGMLDDLMEPDVSGKFK
jgi:hypothetical protein